jgi:sterol desaturase/sphingolipid hydroxylase (fatty acid hydroxylase superfamily)
MSFLSLAPESAADDGRMRSALLMAVWPGIYCLGLFGTYVALASTHPLIYFNCVYLAVALCIGLLERVLPHERKWLAHDGQSRADLSHTVFNKGVVQIIAATLTYLKMATAVAVEPTIQSSPHIWPDGWPLAVQVALGLVVAEFGLYVAHRAAHELPAIWRFHALHHSVTRLWVLNTGRFHIVDTLLMVILSQLPLYLLGAPLSVVLWISGITAFTGLLTHCNIAVRTGPLDWIFATPALHRWHHSKVLAEGNMNYGENIVLWDLLLRTYYNPKRRPPADIGIAGRIADGFIAQLLQPFTRQGGREILNIGAHGQYLPAAAQTATEQASGSSDAAKAA